MRPLLSLSVIRCNMRMLLLLVLSVLALLQSTALQAQEAATWDPQRTRVTRADLTELLARYDALLKSRSHSSAFKTRLAREAALIQRRLRDGDVQVGDRIQVSVEGNPALSDTFAVRPGLVLSMPNVGDIPVGGLLRSELQARISKELGRYMVEPVVRVQPLIRVTVAGEVGAPGYYLVPSESLVSDVLMAAGGPTGNASLAQLRIVRDGKQLVEGPELQKAIAEGQTLDQLNLYPGDQVYLPRQSARGEGVLRSPVLQALGVVSMLATLIVRLF